MQKPARSRLLVNALTGSRLLFAVAVAVLAPWAREHPWAIITATALLLAIEITDLLDGHLARKLNAVSDFGKMFDPYSDSVSRLMVYWTLAIVGRCWAVVPLVMAVRDVTVSYSRILMTRRGQDVAARQTGKLKAIVQGACAPVLMIGPLFWGSHGGLVIHTLSAAVIAMTFASMIDYGRAALTPPSATDPTDQ